MPHSIRTTLFLFLGLFLAVSSLLRTNDAYAVAAAVPVVYLTPHQDDETITFGASIYNHVKAGRTVYVVQVTDGSSSGAFKLVNNKLAPEGRATISRAAFSAARDREQAAALVKLGVKPANIFHESIYSATEQDPDGLYLRDSRADYGKFLAVVDKYIQKFPNASFKTMSWLDHGVDHYKLGYALNDRCVAKVITDCRFLQSPLYSVGSTLAQAKMPSGVLIPRVATPLGGFETTTTAALTPAIQEYNVWDPDAGRYAIGYFSVAKQFKYVLTHPVSRYHQNSLHWPSTATRKAANAWVATYQKPDLSIPK